MNKFMFFIVILLAATPLLAQEETLFNGSVDIGGYGGPVTRVTKVLGESGLLVGGYGGVLIDHRLMIGGGGYGLVTEHRARPEAEVLYSYGGQPLLLNMGYGGVVIEYMILPSKLVHCSAILLVGGGAVDYRYRYSDWYDQSMHHNPDLFFVAEPGVNLEVNVVSWMRLDIGATYRYVSGLGDLVGVNNSDLRQLSGGLTLKFGAF